MLAQILIIVIVAIAIAAIAERRNVQPALLVAIVGLAASFIPGLTRLELEPDVILGLVLRPLLVSAARDFSFASFTKRLGPIILAFCRYLASPHWSYRVCDNGAETIDRGA